MNHVWFDEYAEKLIESIFFNVNQSGCERRAKMINDE